MTPSFSARSETFFASNDAQTREIGAQLGARLQSGDIVFLEGPLGAGKTTFSQGLARGLQIEAPISSPTFVLINEYHAPIPLLHLDAYRMENWDYEALRDAGMEDFLARQDAVRLIEWPSRIMDYLPTPRFWVKLEIEDEGRKIEIFHAR